MKWMKRWKSLINLLAGEPDIQMPNFIVDRAHKALNGRFTYCTSYYGVKKSRFLTSRKLEERNNMYYDPETEKIVIIGVQQGLYIAVWTLLEEGEEALIPRPHYATCCDSSYCS